MEQTTVKDDLIHKIRLERVAALEEAKRHLLRTNQSKTAERIAYEVVLTDSMVTALMKEKTLTDQQMQALLEAPFVLAEIHQLFYAAYFEKMQDYLICCLSEIADRELAKESG